MHFVSQFKKLNRAARCLLLILSVAVLQACSGGSGGGGSGSDREPNTSSSGSTSFVYSGPAPGNQEIQNFKLGFYDNVVARCSNCHTSGTNVPYPFVDRDDINEAYRAALQFANLDNPSASRFVERMTEGAVGHNCWIPNGNASCAVNMTDYIQRWADGPSQSMTSVTLVPRDAIAIDNILVAPETFAAVEADPDIDLDLRASPELMYLVRTYCSGCHSSTAVASSRQAPYFADANDEVSYQALITKIDVNVPANSRLVARLSSGHNCWSGSNGCDSDAQTMQAAIARFAAELTPQSVDQTLVSAGQRLEDGIVASGGGRFETDVIAKWEFREGDGSTVTDTSAVQPEIPLTISGQFEWVGGWGVNLENAVIQGPVAQSRDKLHQRLVGAGEYTIETWVAPNNVVQEDAWIFGYAGGENSRNTLLAQTMYSYDFYNRSSTNPLAYDGAPMASTPGELAQATLQHVVVTYDPANGRKIYVNGQDAGIAGVDTQATLADWSQSYIISIGDDPTRNNPWQGVIRMIAVHSRALNQEQIEQNYDVGVGQKYYLMFSVSEILDQEGVCHEMNGAERTDYCYIVFEVSQFDSYGYLFKDPRFVNINPSAAPLNFEISGIYLGMNGQLVRTGQGFVNVNATINGDTFTMDDPPLMQRGAIVPIENGPDSDVFFLAFRSIDSNDDTSVEAMPVGPGAFDYAVAYGYNSSSESVQIGMRTFDEINQSYSHITGVPKDNATVSSTYTTIRRSLPQVGDFQTFMASHQMAVMQLAAGYCDALVENTSLRSSFFNNGTPFDFNAEVATVVSDDWRDQVVYPLIDRSYATGLDSQPSRSHDGNMDGDDPLGTAHREELAAKLVELITDTDNDTAAEENPDTKQDGLIYCSTTNPCSTSQAQVARTSEVVKAVCTAVLSSAAATMK